MSAIAPSGVTAVILTFNEQQHIARCIESARHVASRIVVVDSFSTDKTRDLAAALGADVYTRRWVNYADQFQWALDHTDINTAWTMRLDADEYLDETLRDSLARFLQAPGDANAAYFRRKIVFLGQPITHGNFYPLMMLRIWRTGCGRIEARWMDEHIEVGDVVAKVLDGDLVDENLNDLAWWSGKHVGYARREVYDIVSRRRATQGAALSGQARFKRFLKERVYWKLPPALRGSAYFLYRYVFGAGFLDGKGGFYFHFLQACWYRTLVDATLFELENRAAALGIDAYELLDREGVWAQMPARPAQPGLSQP